MSDPTEHLKGADKRMRVLAESTPTKQEQQIQELQESLTAERDARREDQFFFILIVVMLFDVVFFTVSPNLGGPLAILVLQLLILIPLARRMGMEEIATILNGVIHRVAGRASDKD